MGPDEFRTWLLMVVVGPVWVWDGSGVGMGWVWVKDWLLCTGSPLFWGGSGFGVFMWMFAFWASILCFGFEFECMLVGALICVGMFMF